MTCATVLLFSPSCRKSSTPDSVTSPGITAKEIVIGCSAALGGHAQFLGTQYIHGAQAWLNDVNRRGGIHGRTVRLLVYDDQYEPPRTVENTQRLISQDKVFALFNYVGTPTSVKIVDIVQAQQVPALGFFTGAEPLREPFRPMMFHVRDSYYAEAEGAMAYFVDKLGLRRVAVMYQEDAFGLAVLSGVQLALGRRALKTAATDTYERGTMDVEQPLETIRQSQAELVVMVGTYSPLAKFIASAHEAGYFPYFHTVSFVGSEAFGKELVETRKIQPRQYERIVVTQVVPSPYGTGLPAVRRFTELQKESFPEDQPNYVALEGFLNGIVLTKALTAAGPHPTRAKLIDALESMRNVDLGIGKGITYGKHDHAGIEGIWYSRLSEQGRFESFEP